MISFIKKHPVFARFIMGRFLVLIADQFLMFAIPLVVYRNTGSISLSGFVFFLEWLPRIISLPLAGVLSDRIGGRLLFMISDIIRAITCFTCALFIYYAEALSYQALCVLAVVSAYFQAQSFIAFESIMPKLFKHSQLIKVQTILQSMQQLSMVLGPVLCAGLVILLPTNALFYFSALIYAISFISILLLKPLKHNLALTPSFVAKKNSIAEQMVTAISILRRNNKLLRLVILSILINSILGVLLGSASIISISIFDVTDQAFGMMQFSLGAASVIALISINKIFKRWQAQNIFIVATLFIFLGSLVAALASVFILFVIGYSVMIAALAIFNVYMRAERMKLIPNEDQGKVLGLMVMFNQLPLPLSGLLITGYAALLGPQILLLIVISLCFVPYILLVLVDQRRKIHTKPANCDL